jgi:hypothetical protein
MTSINLRWLDLCFYDVETGWENGVVEQLLHSETAIAQGMIVYMSSKQRTQLRSRDCVAFANRLSAVHNSA